MGKTPRIIYVYLYLLYVIEFQLSVPLHLLFVGCCCSDELVKFAKEMYILKEVFLTAICFEWFEMLIFQITQILWEA